MRILIVDDDRVSRTKMKTILQSIGTCTDEDKAPAALKTFENALKTGQEFDLVTLDIRMPDMDGTELLYKIREHERNFLRPGAKHAKVFMVTSQSDKDSLITCLQAGCDGFVVKPFTREVLFEKLEMKGLIVKPAKKGLSRENVDEAPAPAWDLASRRKNLIGAVTQALQQELFTLPTLPDMNTRLREMVLRQRPSHEITELLKQDMLISGSVISLSNSALYKGVGPCKTLEDAVTRLGVDQTFRHVDMLCQKALYSNVGQTYSGYVDKLWKHAQACAYASQHLAGFLDLHLSEDPFTLGLVHDIGRLILLQIIMKLEEVEPAGGGIDPAVLYETLDAHHGSFGAALLGKWGFSDVYDLVARYHDCPEKSDTVPQELALVSFANVLVHHIDNTADAFLRHPVVRFCTPHLNITPDIITEIREAVRDLVAARVH